MLFSFSQIGSCGLELFHLVFLLSGVTAKYGAVQPRLVSDKSTQVYISYNYAGSNGYIIFLVVEGYISSIRKLRVYSTHADVIIIFFFDRMLSYQYAVKSWIFFLS